MFRVNNVEVKFTMGHFSYEAFFPKILQDHGEFFSKTLVTLKLKTKLYSQTGCSFDGNFATFRRNIGNLSDSLNGASCNPRAGGRYCL